MKRVLLIAACLAVLVVLGGCGPKVPDLKGMTPAQAEKVLTGAGFSIGAITYDAAANGAIGSVVRQTPQPGEASKQGSAVTLVVAGFPPARTPILLGLDEGEARAALGAVGLSLGAVEHSDSETTAVGLVISQLPVSDSMVPSGTAVAVVVSDGPSPRPVPNVMKKSQKDAIAALEASGFLVQTKSTASSLKKGLVAAQSVKAGTLLRPGKKVVISLSKGPAPTATVDRPDEAYLSGNAGYSTGDSGSHSPGGSLTVETQGTKAIYLRKGNFRYTVSAKDDPGDGFNYDSGIWLSLWDGANSTLVSDLVSQDHVEGPVKGDGYAPYTGHYYLKLETHFGGTVTVTQ